MMSEEAQSVGVIVTDRSLVVQSWNDWMSRATGVDAAAITGKQIHEVFPDLVQRGLLARLERVVAGKGVEVLASAFHGYFIPCPPLQPSRFDRMRQHVTITPLLANETISGATITIEDVTARLDSERALADRLASKDESLRFQAAETLASLDSPADLAVGAMADESWRVRRAAVDAMAKDTSPDAVATLVDAINLGYRDASLLNSALSAVSLNAAPGAVAAVSRLLDTDNADIRTYAALALGMLGDARGVSALMALLDDPDANVQYHAIEALGRIGDRVAAGPLVSIAERQDFFLSFAALEALALIGDPSVAPQLLPLLQNDSLVDAVVQALGALAAEEAVAPLMRVISRAGAPVASIADALVRIHVRQETERSEGAIVADVARLAASGDHVRALSDAFRGAGGPEKAAIATVLGWLGQTGIEEVLAPLIADEDARTAAADALAKRGRPAAEALRGILAAGDEPTRQCAAVALGRIGDASSVAFLTSALGKSSDVDVAIATALGAIGDRRAFEPLLGLIEHPNASVRHAAVSALNSIGHPDLEDAVRARLAHPSARMREAAARIAGYFAYPSCLEPMLICARDADEAVRRAVVEHLASYDDASAWAATRQAAREDGSHTVRAAAVRSLGRAEGHDAADALLAACDDVNLWVRYYAVRAIGERDDAGVDPRERVRRAAAADPATPVRIAAIKALSTLLVEGRGELLATLVDDPEADLAVAATEALETLGESWATEALLRAVRSSDERKAMAAIRALAAHGTSEAIDALRLAALSHATEPLRMEAIRSLGRIGSDAAIDALLVLATRRALRAEATRALAAQGEQGLPSLSRGLEHDDEQVRAVAVEALARLKTVTASRVVAEALSDSSPSVSRAASYALSRS